MSKSQSLNILSEFIRTDFRLRYHGSLLGYFWTLLKPLCMFVVLYIVFVRFLKFDLKVSSPAIYLLLGMIIWSFFTEASTAGLQAIAARGHLLRKLNFPKWVLLTSVVAAAGISFVLNFVVVLIFAIVNQVDIGLQALWILPLTIEACALFLGVGAILSVLYINFRDISPIWELTLQIGFYGTPILYTPLALPPLAAKILILFPVAQIIQDFRYVFISKQTVIIETLHPEMPWLRGIPIGITVLILIFGLIFFQRSAKFFAERI